MAFIKAFIFAVLISLISSLMFMYNQLFGVITITIFILFFPLLFLIIIRTEFFNKIILFDYPVFVSLIPSFVSVVVTSYLIFVVDTLKVQWFLELSKITFPWNIGIIIIGLIIICMIPFFKNDILDKDAILPISDILSDYINKFNLSETLASKLLTVIIQLLGYVVISSQLYVISSQIGNKIFSLINEGVANLPWKLAIIVMLIVVIGGSFIFLFVINFKEKLWESRKKNANQVDRTYEWQSLTGERITSATRKDIFEKKHGSGSWDKTSSGLDTSLLIFAFTIPALLSTIITGFFTTMSLGLYIVIFLICELTLIVSIGLFIFINSIRVNLKDKHQKL